MRRPRTAKPRPSGGTILAVLVLATLAAVFGASALATGFGQLLAEIWVSVIAAIIGLFGG